MHAPRRRAAKIGLFILLALIALPAMTMGYFQTLGPPAGVKPAELKAAAPSERLAIMGAGVLLWGSL